MKNEQTGSRSGKNKARVIIILAAVVIAAAVLWLSGTFSKKAAVGEGVVGVIVDDWDPGLKEPVPEQRKGIQIPGYSTAHMNAGDTSLKISIGNPKENEVGFYASIKLDDGTVLYESELLRPGQGLTEVPLSKTLEKGRYSAAVVYRCVLLDESLSPLNGAESGFTLIVD